MRYFLLCTCLCLAAACAGLGNASLHHAAAASDTTGEEGMLLSHSEPDAPRCFTAVDHRLICPEGGAAIYGASDAAVHTNPPSMELEPGCANANASAQCVVQPGPAPAVAEDTNSEP